MSITIKKESYEEVFYTHQFRRSDGKGWLGSSETLTDPAVAVLNSAGEEQEEMVGYVSVVEETKVRYQLKGGDAGKSYTIRIRTETSDGNKFEDNVTLSVL